MFEAVKQDYHALGQAAPEHKADENVLEAAKQNGNPLQYASPDELQLATPKHKKEHDIVLEAVKQNENPPEYAAPKHKTGHAIAEEADAASYPFTKEIEGARTSST